MADLWAQQRQANRRAVEPLAVRLRPRTLDEFVGQQQFLGPRRLLRRMIDADQLTSLLFCGPPGTGKTSLAEVIAAHTERHFEVANAASVGVKEIREILGRAVERLEHGGKRTILFLDEIHRFARNQQDVLLDHVERGLITLIGATTENPFFAINSALVSRSTVFRFEALNEDDIVLLLRRAVTDDRAFPNRTITIDDDALRLWATKSDGDARRALTALEVAVLSESTSADDAVHINLEIAQESIQQKALVYEGTGDAHYDLASAFIKSMRGSDPDAAVYWLARMLEAGEDPRFIARRMAILASEDIGNADPRAIELAAAAWIVTERVGMPECQLTLAQAVIYLAVAPKSNACTRAIGAAMTDVREGRTVPVPLILRDGNSTVARTTGKRQNYRSPHASVDGQDDQDYLGVDRIYYEPTMSGLEAKIRDRLEELRQGRNRTTTNPEGEVQANRDSR